MTPSRNLVRFSLLLLLFGLGAALFPWLKTPWLVLFGLVLGLAVLDAYLSRRERGPGLSREAKRSIPVGVWSEIGLELYNRSGRRQRVKVHDHHPPWFEVESMPQTLLLPDRRSARIRYRVRPTRRGDGLFPGCDLVTLSPLGLWERRRFLEVRDRVRVFPNFREISRYALLATDNRLSQMGVRRRQRRGEGNDFHQLREYRSGDSLRQIDWKASSRYRKLISKEYQDERDQQVVFVLDCGRRMRHAESDRVHLDEALNAMLLLAHVADQQGDAVGFLAFGGQRRWLPPRKGGVVVRQLLEQTYDLEATNEASDYLVTARELMSLQSRRALVVVLTNTRDEDQQDLITAVQLLRRRHLVVVANLRESMLDEALEHPVHDIDTALRFHAVNDYLESRRKSQERLKHQGAIALDLLAPQLPVALVNNYLTIKASGSL
jgi:uncharacterized protein (DUF58 family)